MLHKVSTVGVVNLTNAIGHPINILTRVVAYRLNRAVSVRPANTDLAIRYPVVKSETISAVLTHPL